ncbi:DUF624 domain-containing protein [Salibacterium salarium]|uniref:DUF624 domain-containing protein n=1 Tax=Salibacterium salarium TaxID=284579 RepID=A0A3R9P7L2_9BACI|nr:DUF624 domain-containing protein [Salibacterium salarium]RSL33065.1 DUF624 domain-containing protein [Salibacterium salarium]
MHDATVARIDDAFRWLSRLALLNLLWLVSSLAGLFVFGAFPALTAMLGVTRKWILDKSEIPIVKTYFKQFKNDFWKANAVGWIMIAIGSILYLNFELLLNLSMDFSIVVIFAFYFIIFLFSIVTINIFPLYVHYEASIINQFKNAFIIGMVRIPVTLVLLVLAGGIAYLGVIMPTVVLFFSGSLLSYTAMRITLFSVKKIDYQVKSINETSYTG